MIMSFLLYVNAGEKNTMGDNFKWLRNTTGNTEIKF